MTGNGYSTGEANHLLLNDGSGSFSVSTGFPVSTSVTTSFAFGDIDGDSDLDLFVGNSGTANQLLLNDGSGGFTVDANFIGGSALTRAVALADVDADGDLDVIVGNDGEANELLINAGLGVFSNDAAFPGGHARTFAVAVADVDADGDVDVTFGDFASINELLLYSNCPDGGAQLHAASACFACPPFMGRETPSICLECISDVMSQGVFGTGESCAIPCVLQQRPMASDACEPCTAFPGTFYDAALERFSTNPNTWVAPRCADCDRGKYADTLSAGIVCLPCIPGKFAAGIASGSCDLCPAGKFNTEVSATECNPCPAGGFCATGSVNSQLCPGARTCTTHPQAYTSQACAGLTHL